MHDELWRYNQFQIAGDGHEAIPAIVCVGAVAATAHEGDFAMAKLVEMAQRKLGGTLLVENHIRYALDLAMTCDGDSWETAETFFEGSIDEDKAFDGTIHEETWILLDEIGLPAVTRGEVKVPLFDEMLFNAAENLHGVTVTEFGYKNADSKCLALAQGAREKAGTVVEFCGSFGNAIACFLGDGANSGSIVQNQRDGSRRKIEVFAEGTQTNGLAGPWRQSWLESLGHALLF